MSGDQNRWEGTFECWRNPCFAEVYARFTNRRLVTLEQCQVFLSSRPLLGTITAHVYAPPRRGPWLSVLDALADRVGAAWLRVYSPSQIEELEPHLVEEPKTLVVDLEGGEDALWKAVGPKTRNMIRRGQSKGVSVRQAQGENDFECWWQLYASLAHRVGFAPQDRQLVRALLSKDRLARLFVSECQGTVVAGSFFLTNAYPMYWLGAVDRRYGDFAAGHANMWSALVHFQALGYQLVDLGGIDPNEEGSTRFKKAFSRDVRTAWVYRVPVRRLKARVLAPFVRCL